jgi:hypothetical protein
MTGWRIYSRFSYEHHSPPTIRSRENKDPLFFAEPGKTRDVKIAKYESQYFLFKNKRMHASKRGRPRTGLAPP